MFAGELFDLSQQFSSTPWVQPLDPCVRPRRLFGSTNSELLQNSKKVSAVRIRTLTDPGKSVKLWTPGTLTLTQTSKQLSYLSRTLDPASHSLVFTYKRTDSPKQISDCFILIFVFYSSTCSWGSITWYLKDQNKSDKTGHVCTGHIV